MNTYFIHTVELSYLLTFDEYDILNRSLRRINNDGSYKCLIYAKEGIKITFRKCTENEIKRKGFHYPYKLILIVNPSRLIETGTYVNKIYNYNNFMQSLLVLNEKIRIIFSELIPEITGINCFDLSRVDITKDIFGIPENVIHEYITIIRKLPLHYGYHLNYNLEEKCLSFNPENSVNIVSDSRKG